LPEGQFYWVDLVGLKVVNEEGVPLGRVTDLIRGPAGDCLAVSGVEDQLIPFSWQTTVLAVDLKSRRIQVRSTR
jgi:16S rRNA processing protein RimM